MDSHDAMQKLAKRVNGLTLAVWILVAANLLMVAVWVAPAAILRFHLSQPALPGGVSKEFFESWEGLSIEEKLGRASVVLITEYRRETSISPFRKQPEKTQALAMERWPCFRALRQTIESRTQYSMARSVHMAIFRSARSKKWSTQKIIANARSALSAANGTGCFLNIAKSEFV
jgi:hypothetical protein